MSPPRTVATSNRKIQSRHCAARFAQMAAEQQIVAAIRLPHHVEDVAEEGNGSYQYTDAEIRRHPRQRHVGHSADPCRYRNDERQQSGEHVAQAGNQSDDAIDAEAKASCPARETLRRATLPGGAASRREKATHRAPSDLSHAEKLHPQSFS